jgi:hypothetical protein
MTMTLGHRIALLVVAVAVTLPTVIKAAIPPVRPRARG